MALDKETIEQIKGVLKKARAQAGRFLYCISGEDGEPVLLLHPRKIPASEVSLLLDALLERYLDIGVLVKAA